MRTIGALSLVIGIIYLAFAFMAPGNMDHLQDYSWPGNVRELRNVVERAVILSDRSTLEIPIPAAKGAAKGKTNLDEVQADHIRSILEQTHWRVRGRGGAAAILGLKPTTLEYRMKRLGIVRPSSHTSGRHRTA